MFDEKEWRRLYNLKNKEKRKASWETILEKFNLKGANHG